MSAIPPLGLGTYQQSDHQTCIDAVETALDVGYRHIDTAQGYENETSVGAGLTRSSVPREELFVASKLATENLAYDDVIETAVESLDRLGLETLDLLYVHWPLNSYDPAETLPALDELVDRGLIEHVGVSNFEPRQLAEARDVLDAPIAANQVECHPLLQQERLRADAADHDYQLVAYSPLAQTEILDDPTIVDVAEHHDATPAQVCLAWLRHHDIASIPKATGRTHISENYDSLDVTLDPAAIERLDAIEETHRVVDFDAAPWHAES
ncbi:aldehyde oxidoreductase [Halobacteriales archaeon SW_8_65_20]|nr:MAG: aldehyde oxidoreductase [Halobacteriales archaeon SW_8_65_20]